MGKSILRDLIILIAVFAVIWGIFANLSIFPDETDHIVSAEKEKIIGDELVEDLITGVDTISHPVINQFVDLLYQTLYHNIESSEFDYSFIITEDSDINAFAMPGGYIIINSGLINFCESTEELASIVAHEMGHIENRHLISRLIKKLGLTVLLSGDATVIEEVGHIALETVFDRNQEKEADLFACELLEKSHISPRVISRLFRRLEAEGKTYNQNLELLMTHPHHNERIKAALEYQLDSTFVESKLDLDIQSIKDVLKAR